MENLNPFKENTIYEGKYNDNIYRDYTKKYEFKTDGTYKYTFNYHMMDDHFEEYSCYYNTGTYSVKGDSKDNCNITLYLS